jgi:hypothetical protein
MTTDTEALVRPAYHLAEGDALHAQGSSICSPRAVASTESAA